MLKTTGLWSMVLAALCAAGIGGCALLGPSVQKAQDVMAERQEAVDAARAEWEKALADLGKFEARWAAFQGELKAATDSKNFAEMERLAGHGKALLAEGKALFELAKEHEGLVKASADAVDAAIEDFKSAKSTSDYLGVVGGWLQLGLGALLGTGGAAGVGAAVVKKKDAQIAEAETEHEALAAAARITAANAKAKFGSSAAWKEFLDEQEKAMAAAPGARDALRIARS